MPKASGRAYDMCLKPRKTRTKLYRKKSVKKQRTMMCSEGRSPRCVKGLSYCVKTRLKASYKKK